jgi:hypothetical protein
MTAADSDARNPDALSKIFYKTSRVEAAFEAIDRLIGEGWEENYCKALPLFGPPGSGKTHILTNYVPERAPDARIRTIEVEAGCTLKRLATSVLDALGDPAPGYFTQAEQTSRAAEGAARLHLDALVFEEFHRLIDSKTDRVNQDVGNWVTGFLNRRACPLILVGEPIAMRVLRGNAMLARRCMPTHLLMPMDFGADQDRKDFRGLLHSIDRELGFPQLSGLVKPDTAKRIYAYCRGLPRLAADLISDARFLARKRGLPALNHEVLGLAVDRYRVGMPDAGPNPFRTDEPPDAEPAPLFPDSERAGPAGKAERPGAKRNA